VELSQRNGDDRFLQPGQYRSLEMTLRARTQLAQVRPLVISAFDRSTRMLPFVHFDWYMVPCGPRSIAAALYNVGLEKTRFVFQLWNPNVRPSEARIDGTSVDVLLVSSLQVHSAAAYRLVEDGWALGDHRPLIIVGGPKACYEPFDYFGLGPNGQVGADVVVTGEEPVLLELLVALAEFGAGPQSMRAAFNRARDAGALRAIPGLVYAEDGRYDGLNLVNTGIQRLLRDLDDLPMPSTGYRTLEPPHRGKALAEKPILLDKACNGAMVASVLVTRGCKFHCHYCPIPAYNQRSFRCKSPARMIEEFRDCYRYMHTRNYFGTDDNFFNSRRFVQKMFEAMASTTIDSKPLRRRVRFFTQATVRDLYKNRDLLPLAHDAGLGSVWIGVEDLSAVLIDKGQTPVVTQELFADMLAHKISPMAMLMHHDDQPLHSPGRLTGLIDQINFLRDAGAVSLQCTLANPALGTRWINEMLDKGLIYDRVGGQKVCDGQADGNHVIASTRADPWRKQLNLLRGYAAFYNPANLVRALWVRNKHFARKRVGYQLWGMLSLARTAWKLKGYTWRLWRGPIECVRQWPERFRRSGSPYPDLIDSRIETHSVQPTALPPSASPPVPGPLPR